MEHQHLFDIAGKRFIKESGPLKGSPREFIGYEYNESKKINLAPFIEGTHFHFTIFSDSNQLISKLNEGPKVFVRNSKVIAMTKICITFYQVLSLFITSYHTIFPWQERNHLMLATLKLVPSLQIFYYILSCLVTLYHTLSHLILYAGKKTIDVGNFKISFQAPDFLSHLITSCHTLSHLSHLIL